MGQGDILTYLKENSSRKNPKSTREIEEALGVDCGTPLKTLRRHGGVFSKKIKIKGIEKYFYWYKK